MSLPESDKCVALSEICIYYKWKIFKKFYRNKKIIISETKWDEEFEAHEGFYSVSYIQGISTRNIKHWPINHQIRYMSVKFKKELHSKLSQDAILKFWHPELRNYLEVLKEG